MATPSQGPSEAGLPVERTTLAWLRTTLAFMVGAVIMTRLIASENILLAIVHAVLTLPLGASVTWVSWRRRLHSEQSMREERPLPDAMLPIGVAAMAVFLGCSSLLYTLAAP